ncbi:MAG: hypothetical protein AABY53_07305 [Bdellovibrionota bacterium]
MISRSKPSRLQNSSGFIAADFLFSFVMVLGVGIFMFGITFSLATIEVAQYIVWSTARNHSAGNINAAIANEGAKKKFLNLTAKFPMLTGNGAGGREWFELLETNLKIGDLSVIEPEFSSEISADDRKNNDRQPWTGASAKIRLKLFSGLQIPFLGKVAEDPSFFEFPIRAFIIRHPSQDECISFFNDNQKRYINGIKKLEGDALADQAPMSSAAQLQGINAAATIGEDNGC